MNSQKLMMWDTQRNFEVDLHLMVTDMDKRGEGWGIVLASYVGIPDAVSAISAGILEGRTLSYQSDRFERTTEKYKRLEKKIGMGDVAHGVVYNNMLTIDGVESISGDKGSDSAYIFAADGDIDTALSLHVIERFGFPSEWINHYPTLFKSRIRELKIFRNELFTHWEQAKCIEFRCSEDEAIELIRTALRSGQLCIPSSDVIGEFEYGWDLKTYMLRNAEHLARKLEQKQPRHTLDSPVDPAIADMKRIPFPIQAHMIQAIINTIYEESCICGGDMGTGKSIVACGVSHVMHETKKRRKAKKGTSILLSAPGITLPKWKDKEIALTIPHAKVRILRNSEDVLKMYREVKSGYRPDPNSLEFTLVGIDRAKLDGEKVFSGIWKRLKGKKSYAWHCPDCGQPLYVKNDIGDYVESSWEDAAAGLEPSEEDIFAALASHTMQPNGIPLSHKVSFHKKRLMLKCNAHEAAEEAKEGNDDEQRNLKCSTPLWRPALKQRAETRRKPRVCIAHVLKKMNKYFDLYICDEAHQCKAEDSGRGYAFAQMVAASKHVLMLTGTVTNGKSTSIKELLWRTDAKSLLQAGITYESGVQEWASRFGKLEKVVSVEEGDEGVITKRKRRGQQVREAAGIAPQLTANFLLHKSGFLELSDLGLPLVKLKEIPVFIDMDEEHKQKYMFFHKRLYDTCKSVSSGRDSVGVWSKFNPSTIMYGDRPDLGAKVVIGEECIIAPALEGELHAKERWLVDLVRKELNENRRVTIYNNFTGGYEMNQRLHDILTRSGIRCCILDEPNTELRQERLYELESDEVPVIITNMKLVEVGLDLMYWNTIIFYQLNYEVSTVRQSSRRAWRIGQEKECRVYYPVYNGTQQMTQFVHVMHARGHALMVEGRLDKSDLAEFSRDSQSALASDLASCFASNNLVDTWNRLATKDLEGIEMVEEAEFAAILKDRMKELTNQTLLLCGVDISKRHDTEQKTAADENIFGTIFAEESMERIFPDIQPEVIPVFGNKCKQPDNVIEIKNLKDQKKLKKRVNEDQLCWNF
ncbi:helicase-related protein [Paenibacillus thiaminolyticus]|uniref:Helicase ATP-binding domain-containing protein n=1 Tax=Paenibacillus thiaminolyticus TaxID=49283 RepID=A0A3A3GDM5_PANTH|nr:helicase-related protein [Paenibacillus thiaminolyticus]RJG21368.1 hypothetical protein DQX05_21970 [Paenibacillus thiaminolyticus]